MTQARFEDARRHQEFNVRISKQLWGTEHTKTAMALSNLASAIDALGRHEEARKLHDEAVDIRTAALPPEHLHHAWAWLGRGSNAYALGQLEQARRDMEAARERFAEHQGKDNHAQMAALVILARIAIDEGRRADAGELLDEADRVLGELEDDEMRAQLAFCRAQLAYASDRAGARSRAEGALSDYPKWKHRSNSSEFVRDWIESHPAG